MTKGDKLYYQALRKAKGTNCDFKEVIKLLKEASDLNNGKASYALATWYINGHHLRKNYKKGFELLKIAELKKDEHNFGLYKDVLFDIAVCYELGHGVNKNKEKAFAYYVLSAYYGEKDACEEILRCLYYGIGIDKNAELLKIINHINSTYNKNILS